MRDLLPEEDGYQEQEIRLLRNIEEIKNTKSFEIFERNPNHKVKILILGCW